ncbi:substrate-binding periplasmic protein [Propylenella binzhouense]|uniref:Transporter substrate-binding domain-containing protein n=1 Tax=Propylenella binzhouense TaxID=2555902 RepID=A0A964T1C0_9HYPH|nr:transporter substrate-binding domain-containing protein [Propylenella binzhouense]MYZ46480.1 transporter substrate-binding domain-containing protein [Propylenella binzhouense]
MCVPAGIRRYAGILVAALICAATAALPASAQQTPFVPEDFKYGTHEDKGTLRFCLDPRDPEWRIAQDIADAIASALLLTPEPKIVSDPIVTAGWDSLYRHFLKDCDIYFGFKLIPGGYPRWLALSRPYYDAAYVLAVQDPDWNALSDIPLDKAIGSAIGTTADFAFIKYRESMPAGARWRRFPMANNEAALQALKGGTVAAALVWGPAVWAIQQADPAYAGLRLISPSPLPVATLGVGAAMLANETFLRSSLDQAIGSLAADGTLAAILARHHFPGTIETSP